MNYSAINKRLIALCNWSKFANFAEKRKGKIMTLIPQHFDLTLFIST